MKKVQTYPQTPPAPTTALLPHLLLLQHLVLEKTNCCYLVSHPQCPAKKKKRCSEENETPKRHKILKMSLDAGKSPSAASRKRRCPEDTDTPQCSKRRCPDENEALQHNKKQKTLLQNKQNRDRVFKRSRRPATSNIPDFVTCGPTAADCIKQTKPDRVDMFLLMCPPTLRELTVDMSNIYSMQTKEKALHISMDELLTFYGILLTSGYSSVPRRHMYWTYDPDVYNETKQLSIDENMILYYGKNGCKQFIRGKPIWFWYKLWSLALPTGYMLHMYVVLGLAEQAEVPPGCTFVHDNLFTSLSLIDEMTKQGYGSFGTLRQCCLHDIHFTGVKDFMKMPRGSTEDNSVVTMATNAVEQGEKSFCQSATTSVFLYIQPKHGQHDLHDLHVSRYGSAIRSKKWSQGRRSAIAKPQDSTRGDGKHHWPVNTGKRYQRCRWCHNCTVYGCKKCDVPLHTECFKIFHEE
uniref:PiggyBac transposable element-derived protein domain-containing protein n=1 Tax=Stegastes partitus TaxID=144197 RepID=A0A3B4ZSX5_9TELE